MNNVVRLVSVINNFDTFCLLDLIAKLRRNFCQMLRIHQMNWSYIQSDGGPSITDRYSHSACYFQQSMYIFGGCTSTNTTFNDLWRFDLATRQWVRPLAMGMKFHMYMTVLKQNLRKLIKLSLFAS